MMNSNSGMIGHCGVEIDKLQIISMVKQSIWIGVIEKTKVLHTLNSVHSCFQGHQYDLMSFTYVVR